MPYEKQTWHNLPTTDTPINAARLGHIEDGIEAASNAADGNLPSTGGTIIGPVNFTAPATALSYNLGYDTTLHSLVLRRDPTVPPGSTRFVVHAQSADPTGIIPVIDFVRSNDTAGEATAVEAGFVLGQITFWGNDGTKYTKCSAVTGIATETHDAAHSGSAILFYTAITGGTATGERMRLVDRALMIGTLANSAATSLRLRVNTPAVSDDNATVQITSSGDAVKGLVVQARVGQTAPLSEWQNETGDPVLAVDSAGRLQFGDGSTQTGTPPEATDLESALTLINDLREKLLAAGIART